METKPKRQLTEKQRIARIDNLAKGRKKRMDTIKQKRETKDQEYDISSDESYDSVSSSDSDNDAFVISKAKKRQAKPVKQKEISTRKSNNIEDRSRPNDHLKSEVDELKTMIIELANMQKKQNKTVRKSRPSGGTKIVVLPQNSSGGGSQAKATDDYMEKLRKSIFD